MMIEWATFEPKITKKHIFEYCNKIVGDDISCILFLDKVYCGEDEAARQIEKISGQSAGCLVAKYSVPMEIKPSEKMDEYDKKLEKVHKKILCLSDAVVARNGTVRCQKCGSMLNHEYLKGVKCPLCKNDLRSQSTKDKEARYRKQLSALQIKAREESERIMKKAKRQSEYWIVRIAYDD